MCTHLQPLQRKVGGLGWVGAAAHPDSPLILHSRIQLVEHVAEPLAHP